MVVLAGRVIALLFCGLFACELARAQIGAQLVFEPADPSRAHMDIGGVWNGTGDVSASGDRFAVEIANASTVRPLEDISASVAIPSTFDERFVDISPSLSSPGCGVAPVVDASRVADELIFDFGGYDLPAGCTLTFDFGLVANSVTPTGTHSVILAVSGTDNVPDPEDIAAPATPVTLTDQAAQGVLVLAGTAVADKTPAVTPASVGDAVSFAVSVTNSGLGGLFDVVIDETALGGGLALQSISQTAPADLAASIVGPVATLPYLAPGETFSVDVATQVASCQALTNVARFIERTGAIDLTAEASILLNRENPDVSVSISTATIPFGETGTISLEVTNSGLGDAADVVVNTSIETLALDVVAVTPGWTYDAADGSVSLIAGPLAAGGSQTVEITVQDTGDVCLVPDAQLFTVEVAFADSCETPFSTPSTLGEIDFDPVPDIELTGVGPEPILEVGDEGAFTLTLAAVNADALDDDPIVVTHTLPPLIDDGAVLTPSAGTVACSGACGAQDVITWTVPRAALASDQTLGVTFDVVGDACAGGQSAASSGGVSTAFAGGVCPLQSDVDLGHVIINTTFTELGDPVPRPTLAFNASAGVFETGIADDGDSVREEGEGEAAQFTLAFEFNAGDPGVWAGAELTDNFGNLAAVLVTGSLEYRLSDVASPASGSFQPVPTSAFTSGGGLSIDLSFLSTLSGEDNSVAGDRLELRYALTAPDSVLGGAVTRGLTQLARLTVPSGQAVDGACVLPGVADTVEYVQAVQYAWQRASGEVELTLGDNIIDVCEVVDATIDITNAANGRPIRNLLATLDLGADYELVSPDPPVFGGGLGGGASVTYSPTDPSVTLNDESLASAGTATVQIRRRATASGPGGALGVQLDYDDNETALAEGRVFSASDADAPDLVNEANLAVFVSPSNLPATGETVQWQITVTNTQSGVAFGAELTDTLPPGLSFSAANVAAMDTINTGVDVEVTGDDIRWGLGDIPAGQSVVRTLVATVDGTNCSIPTSTNNAQAAWGCGGAFAEVEAAGRPELIFPTGDLQIVHDTTGVGAELCGMGTIAVIVRNGGISELTDVVVTEQLNTALTGFELVPGSVEFAVDGGSYQPAGSVPAGSTLVFDAGNVPPLALLGAFGQAGSEIRIRFNVTTDTRTNASTGITVSGAAGLHCGAPVSSPGSSFTLPLDRPEIRVAKTGRNLTTGAAFGENVFGVPGDEIEWRIAVTNNGDVATQALRLRDLLAGSGATTVTISGPGLPATTVTPDYFTIDDVPANATVIYTVLETLGPACVSNDNIADVTWGCAVSPAPAGDPSPLSSPIDNTDGAALVMIPDASAIQLNALVTDATGSGALTTNGRVTITVSNAGAALNQNIVSTVLPTGFSYDPSFTPQLTNSSSLSDAADTVVVGAADPSAPVFTLTDGGSGDGLIRHGETLSLIFAIVQTAQLDTVSDVAVREETPSDGSDPTAPADGTLSVRLDFESGCGSAADSVSSSVPVQPKTPDLDVDILDPIARIVSATGDSETYQIAVSNRGETAAENGELRIDVGAGWSGPPPAGCTGAIPGALVCDLAALAGGASRTFDLALTVANEASPLSLSAEVEGDILDAAGADTGGDYSLDAIEAQTLGFRQSLSLQSTSEADFTSPDQVQIGEEAVLRITSVWFGAGGAQIEAPQVALAFENLTGFSRISETVTRGPAIASTAAFGGAAPGSVIYTLPDLTGATTSEIDVTVRALNDDENTAGLGFDFVSSASSMLDGILFADTVEGFTLVAERTETLTFQRPVLEVTKQVRNVTESGSFADNATGDATDIFEYQIVLTNTGSAPAFDLSVLDIVPADFAIVGFDADSLDNDGDGSVDEAEEGNVAGQQITFDVTNGVPGFAELAAGSAITLLYQVTADTAVNPSDVAVNQADFVFDSLTGETGGQTGTTGANGDANGAFEGSGQVTATIMVSEIALSKALTLTSVGNDTATDVVVGEQADFQLQIILPAGTVEDFLVEDDLPEGLAIVSRETVVFGDSVSCPAPTMVPAAAALPASGAPLTISWDFGTCVVNPVGASGASTEAERMVTLSYKTQVENIAAVVDSAELPNRARFNHSALTDAAEIAPVILTVGEPELVLELASDSSQTNLEAGAPFTVSYTLRNDGSAPAFNVDLSALLNDNGVASGPDGDVNTAVPFGDALRDIGAIDCATASDATSGLGDFQFTFDAGDGDDDGSDELADCGLSYVNSSTDGFAAGSAITFTLNSSLATGFVLQTEHSTSAAVAASSLPSDVAGFGDTAFERSAASDASGAGRFASSAATLFTGRNLPRAEGTITDTSDELTVADNGSPVDGAIGETYTHQATHQFHEGTIPDVLLQNRVQLVGVNNPADVEFLSARIARTSIDLSAADDPAGLNAVAAGTFVDITGLVELRQSGNFAFFELPIGDVVHAGLTTGGNVQSFVVKYDFRLRDVTANTDGARIRHQGRTQRDDGNGVNLNFTGGDNVFVDIVEPQLSVTKSTLDADGILSDSETVRFEVTATNNGSGPAYDFVLEDILPVALRAGGVVEVSVLIDGAAPVTAPAFSFTPGTGAARWVFASTDPLLVGSRVDIVYDAVADATISPGSTHTNAVEVTAYYSQPAATPSDRRQYPRSNIASVTLGAPQIAFRPDNAQSTQPGSTVIYPHLLDVPASLAGQALRFEVTSTRGLAYELWYDADADGALSPADVLFANGDPLPTTGTLGFFVRTQISSDVADGFRDVATITAEIEQSPGVLLRSSVTDITTVSRLQAGELVASKAVALDRDCDGELSDEAAADAVFEAVKDAGPGDCIVFQIAFTNEGTGPVTDVQVSDFTPAFTSYLVGTAAFAQIPPGLVPGIETTPVGGGEGAFAFPFEGQLQPGESGAVTYGVRLDE